MEEVLIMKIINKSQQSLEPKYKFIPLESVYGQSLEVQWLIENYIPNSSVGMIYGPSGAGKSHVAFDIAVCVANGIHWCGKETKTGHVFIMAGEGHNGVNRRMKAIEKTRGIALDTSRIHLSERAIGIDSEKGLKEVISAIDQLDVEPDLIIIDTLSRHLMETSENSNEDMAKVVIYLERLMRKYDTAIMLVHHTGKNAKNGSRGASSLRSNIDFSFVVEPFIFDQAKHCELSCEKQKDASDDLPPLSFGIEVVELDELDSKGRSIKGACVVPVGFITRNKDQDLEQLALKTFMTDKADWQTNFVSQCTGSQNDETKRRKFRDLVPKLIELGWVKEYEKRKYTICKQQ